MRYPKQVSGTTGDGTRERLEAALEHAGAAVKAARKARSTGRAEPGQARALGEALDRAIEQHEDARRALRIFEIHGTEHGLLAEGEGVRGTVAVLVPPGASRQAREDAIDGVLGPLLTEAAASLGAVPSTSPERFTRERAGRDESGRTVLDVEGRVEGDLLFPAVKPPRAKR